MVSDLLTQAISEITDTDLFEGDEEYARYFSLAVKNGYDSAQRSDDIHDDLQEAIAALEPVTFPHPRPRTVRAVGFVFGALDTRLSELAKLPTGSALIAQATRGCIHAFPEWDALAEAFSEVLET